MSNINDLLEVIAVHREIFGGYTMMADEEAASPEGEQQEAQAPEKTFTQADVDRIIADRLKREDVKGLRAKAAQFDAAQEASKSELQKLSEQLASLQADRAAEAQRATRYRIAAAYGISNEIADQLLTGADEDTITAQAQAIKALTPEQSSNKIHLPTIGRTAGGESTDKDAAARAFFGI